MTEKIQWVYDNLEDNKSKMIFQNRKNYVESGEEKYIEDIVRIGLPEYTHNIYYSGKEKGLYEKLKKCDRKVIMWGIGFRGRRILKECNANCIRVDYIVDSDIEKHGTFIDGVLVTSLENIAQKEDVTECMFLITPMYYVNEIRQELMKYHCEYVEILNNYYSYFADDQYFDDEIISFEEQEIFIDGGCFDLGTTKRFLSKLAKAGKMCKKIYAFEPDRENFERCKKEIAQNRYNNIDIVNAGLWNKDTFVRVKNLATAGAYIEESEGEEVCNARAIALDAYINKNERVTFIKFDIEGAELEALKGAKGIISSYRPKLAICLYHKKEDYWQIPYYVKELVPEYKLYIRHYSNYSSETVLYAI